MTLPGAKLEKLQARHPFIDRASPVVLADYVTTDSGTGAVHTAPGHGAEDYQTGLKYGLEIYCPVGDDGKYLDDGRVPADLVGLTTLETVEDLAAKKPAPANLGVLKKLADAGALLAKAKYPHSYPHCWRSKTPIIFRAVDQWFVSLDKAGHRQVALKEIQKIAAAQGWIPAWGEARIRGAVESRPDWCISRQRSWGVPIIAFYGPDKQPYLDAGVVRAVADKVATKGSNFWYDAKPAEILAGVKLPADWPAAESLTCGRDTLDVWIDSGSTQAAVLKRGQGGTHWPADLYLEGSDQHRGWFQSSLWNSVIASGAAPYRAVLTHGFIVDKNRQKISKSSTYQKPQTADAYIGQYGADVIRLWIASQDFRDDIPVDDEILKNVGEAYRLFRNTFRFQLSNLFDFNAAQHAVPVDKMDALDRWALHQTAVLIAECTKAYDAYEFHRVYQLCNQFCSVTLSATYHDILKDRLYTLGAAHPAAPLVADRHAAPSSTPWSKSWPPSSPSPPTRPGATPRPARNTPPSPFTCRTGRSPPRHGAMTPSRPISPPCSSCAPASPRALNRSARPAPSASRWTPFSPSPARPTTSPCWGGTTDFSLSSSSFPRSIWTPRPARPWKSPRATPRKQATPAARAAGAGCRKLFTPRTEKFAPAAPKPLTPDPTPSWPRKKIPPPKSVPSRKPPPSRR
jgi:isoleucyl-tRNA synthetase